jgi:hypothetical protein
MWFLILMSLAVVKSDLNTAHDHVDLVELNSFHDCLGRHVYDQIIFWEWRPDLNRYHVRAWCLVDDRDLIDRRPTKRHSDGLWVTQWQDRDASLMRTITATHYRHSYSQVDPERENKKLLDERDRLQLTKRSVTNPIEPIPDDTPMLLEGVE